MPTNKKRYSVVETGELRSAMQAAARRWPALSESQRVAQLATLGAGEIERDSQGRAEQIESAIKSLPPFPRDYLRKLRQDWPA